MDATTILLASTLLLLTLLAALLILGIILVLDDILSGEDYVTHALAVGVLASSLQDLGKGQGSILDLGSSRGRLALGLKRSVPALTVSGIDGSFVRVLTSRLRARHGKAPVMFAHGDLFAADVSFADAVHAYLPSELLPRLKAKLQSEMKPGSLVTTYRIRFSDWEPIRDIPVPGLPEGDRIFIYRN